MKKYSLRDKLTQQDKASLVSTYLRNQKASCLNRVVYRADCNNNL